MKKIIFYEPAMCCSSGLCGPSPDQALINLQNVLEKVETGADVLVERYSITQNPKKFMENPQVIRLIQEKQLKALPITVFDGNIVKVGSYPTLEELQKLFQGNLNEEVVPTAALPLDQGCCPGKKSCDIRCGPQYQDSGRGDSQSSCC
jgi:hypothetical protein